MNSSRTIFKAACLLALAGFGAALPPAVLAAAAVEEAQAAIAQGDLEGALKRLNSYLSSSPQDAEARFTRGLVLVKLNKTPEAIKAFADLTRDYPQLPEPYNNLAVLYAQAGDYQKARTALEAALATHPSYATAHENLGDIYAALAGAAYNRALSLDQANQGVRYKLSLISQLNTLTPQTARATQAAAPAAPPAGAQPAIAPPAAAASAAPAAAAGAAAAPTSAPGTADSAGINALLSGWSQAWSSKDADAYLAYYSPEFKPEQGLTRETWATLRRERIAKPAQISVSVGDPQITPIDAFHAQVTFAQDYRADTLTDKVTKVLDLENIGGAWKIKRETVH